VTSLEVQSAISLLWRKETADTSQDGRCRYRNANRKPRNNNRVLPTEPRRSEVSSSPVLTVCTICFIILNLCVIKTFPVRYGLYLCVPYGSHSKQRLFPQTALIVWAL
jgi:hypothetical protein